MQKPKISVLMVNYNHQDTIRETIQSVLGQTYQNLQFVIIDDGSTDHSVDIIREFKDDRIELYCMDKNRHICLATNYGFTKVNGEYLARIDSDDIWYPEKLDIQMQYLEEHPDCHICFSWIDLIDEHGNSINEQCKELVQLFETRFHGQTDCLETFYFLGNCLSHPSVLMEMQVMRETGDFDPGYMQIHDFDYWVRIAKKYELHVLPRRLLAMRRFLDESSAITNNSNETEDSNTRYFNEYMDLRAHFFEDMPYEVFRAAFGKYFVCEDSSSPLELACEKAFLLARPQHSFHGIPPAGIRRFHELFRNPDAVTLLEEKFHFTVKDYYNMTKDHMYYDTMLYNQHAALTEQIAALTQQIAELDRRNTELIQKNDLQEFLINEYASSTSWKITKPLRAIGEKMHSKREP